jgi:hypothetical protein
VFLQLHESYKTVAMLKDLSGFTWHDTYGLNIGAQSEQAYKLLEKVSLSSSPITSTELLAD